MPYSGSIFLTTVYPTDMTGAHGNSGGKSAGKDVFSSGKGQKWLEITGNVYKVGFSYHSCRRVAGYDDYFGLYSDLETGYKCLAFPPLL